MKPAFYTFGIIASIYLSFVLVNKFSKESIKKRFRQALIVGALVTFFWIVWTVTKLSGDLEIWQIFVCIAVFIIGYLKIKKDTTYEQTIKDNEKYINQLKKIDNDIIQQHLDDIIKSLIIPLDTLEHHRKKLFEALDAAKEQIIILSGWGTSFVINDNFRNKLGKCLARGVDVYIGYGYQKSNERKIDKDVEQKAKKTLSDLQEWCAENKTKGLLETFYFPNHSKILICDNKFAVCGSFNWLSNVGKSLNEERSYVIYAKKFVSDEAYRIIANLKDPKKPVSRRGLLKNFVPWSKY